MSIVLEQEIIDMVKEYSMLTGVSIEEAVVKVGGFFKVSHETTYENGEIIVKLK